MTTINIRVDENLKKNAVKVFSGMGIDMSSAVKIFLTQVVNEKSFPFIPKSKVLLSKTDLGREVSFAIKKGVKYKDVSDMYKKLGID